jgi:hypothetical protein
MVWLLPHPFPPSVSSNGNTQEDEKERQLADGKGGEGEEPNHTMVRKPGLL